MKNSKENNKEVSSSSSYTGQRSENRLPEKDFTPCSAGTKVILKGAISEEFDKAIFLNVDWRGEKYSGILVEADETNIWAPQPIKPVKKLNSKRGRGKPGFHVEDFPWSFVHESNMVESKLRFGRDKRTPAYGSCPNSPKPSTSRTNVLNNSFSDFSSMSADNGCFKKKALFNCSKFSDPSKKQSSSLEQHGLQNAKLYAEELQCSEVNSIKTSNNSLDEPDPQFDNVSVEEDLTISCLSRSDKRLENYRGGKINCNLTVYTAEDYDHKISSLAPVKQNFLYSNETADTSSNDSSHDNFNISSSTEILEFDSDLQNVDRSTLDQTAELGFICGTAEGTGMTTTESRPDDQDSACGKKYTTLNNSDLADLELQSIGSTVSNRIQYNEKAKFLRKEMQSDILKDVNPKTSPDICKEVSTPVNKTLSYFSLKKKSS